MTHVEQNVVVARMPKTRLFLAQGVKGPTSFQGLNERTLLLDPLSAESDLKKLGLRGDGVELRNAKVSIEVE